MPLLTDLPLVSKHLSLLCCWIIPNSSKKAKRIISEVQDGHRVNSKERRGAPAPQKCKDGLQKQSFGSSEQDYGSDLLLLYCLFQARAAISVVANDKITEKSEQLNTVLSNICLNDLLRLGTVGILLFKLNTYPFRWHRFSRHKSACWECFYSKTMATITCLLWG